MIIFLDNVESILDPQGANTQDIYGVVKELSQFGNICLCITSRISTVPTACKTIDVPTLSMEAAHSIFYGIYETGDRESSQVNGILEQLDFHPLSVTLLATVAHHSKWSINRLTSEWGKHRIDVLHTRHNESLAATIELSLGSPMFCKLGADARELLGVIAFLPQGINEDNVDRLFPTLSNRTNLFDDLCILSLTYQNNGYITMLAPLREYFCPKDPTSSPLLLATKDHYFSWLGADIHPEKPSFGKTQWITSEDVNVEHLLDVFTSIDPSLADTWTACAHFLVHLYWHKPRLVVLGPKIEGLPDDHQSKPQCLIDLSLLFRLVGNPVEYKRLLVHSLSLWREQGNDFMVAQTLRFLADANRLARLYKEGIEQAREAVEVFKRLNHVSEQGGAWLELARLLHSDDQLDSAEEAASQAINLLSGGDNQFNVCEGYRILGNISRSKGKTEKAHNHFKAALGAATGSNWHAPLFWILCDMADLCFDRNEFEDAHIHIEQAKSYSINDPYQLGRATAKQAIFWYKECKFAEARSEALRAADFYKMIGATKNVDYCQTILQDIEVALSKPVDSQ